MGEGHRLRLRARMERDGWDALRPHEMLELALGFVVPRQDTSAIARALLERFGGLGEVFEAPEAELLDVDGVTPAMARWIALTGEIMAAYRDLVDEEDPRLSCYAEARDFLAGWLEGREDGMWLLYLDFDFALITYERAGGGEDWWAPENVRRLALEAAVGGARYVVFVRVGGPGVDVTDADLKHLNAIAQTLDAMDVNILDCALAAGGAVRSLNREGRLDAVLRDTRGETLRESYLGE